MALGDYARTGIFIDGQYLVQVTSITRTLANGEQAVYLMNEGLGGFTPGSGECTIGINYVIPESGMEFNFDKAVFDRGYHDVQLAVGAQDYIGSGKFLDAGYSQSSGQTGEGTVNWQGEFAPIE